MTEVTIKAELDLSIYGMYACTPPVEKYVVPEKGNSNKEVEKELAQMIADANPSCDFEMDRFHALELPTDEGNAGYRIFWVWMD